MTKLMYLMSGFTTKLLGVKNQLLLDLLVVAFCCRYQNSQLVLNRLIMPVTEIRDRKKAGGMYIKQQFPFAAVSIYMPCRYRHAW